MLLTASCVLEVRHFNLDTRATQMSRGQWELVVKLDDGIEHRVWIQLR